MQNRHVTICGGQEVLEKVKKIEAVIFDGDGVLTNNQVLEGFPDVKPRWRSHYDGQGISLLRAIGIRVCFITNETGESARAIEGLVERWNSLPSTKEWGKVELFTGCAGVKKVEAAETWLVDNKISSWSLCAVMGDDLVDVPMLCKAGLRVAPVSAEWVVKDKADIISLRPGGFGAIRDFANFVLEVRGIDSTALPTE